MAYFKELIALWTLVAVVTASYYTPYSPPYSPQYKEPPYQQPQVKLHKLCSWNVVKYNEYAKELFRGDTWDSCRLDAGRAFIPENNIPNGFRISSDRRVFVTLPRDRLGVYSTLAYFRLDDIGRDEVCPPLTPYPPNTNHTLNALCCSDTIANINRIFIDGCNRLWGVDRQAMGLNDKFWEGGSPKLLIYDLRTDNLLRSVKLPKDMYGEYQLGVVEVIVNVDVNDCEKAYGYILDTYNGCIIVYSFKDNKFWKVCSPEFASDAKYSKFQIKTRKQKDVTYFKNNWIVSCTRDLKNQELLCHSDCQLDEYTIPFAELNSEAIARCSPNSLNVKFLGQKCRKCQVNIHHMNKETLVVWGIQEQNYGVGCWNRENPLSPDTVQLVVSNHQKLPYLTDLGISTVDLSNFLDNDGYVRRDPYSYEPENYVVVLSNNLIGIKEHDFDDYEENFGFYFFVEKEALQAYPQCLPQNYKPVSYQPAPYQPAPYQPAPYKPSSYQPVPYQAPPPPTYKPVYQPAPAPYSPPKPVAYQPPPVYNKPVYQEPAIYRPNQYRYRKSTSEETKVAAADAESKEE